jgi:3'-phosphoadenosine 5'-phosphosulfate sulfotransferase (PAPS reductase)/FAD synthetase/ferredoxin
MYKVIWDSDNNGVCLTMYSAGEALNVCPRPVFWEELDFLELDKQGWIYPHCDEPLLWACDRRYFYKGELVLEVKGGNVFDKPTIINKAPSVFCIDPINLDSLRECNADAMYKLEHAATTFIDRIFNTYKKASEKKKEVDYQTLADNIEKKTKVSHVVVKEDCESFDVMSSTEADRLGKVKILDANVEMFVVSFSGGKDSQAMLDLVVKTISSDNFYVVYSDTGYELPTSLSLYKDVEDYYKKSYPDIRFELARNHEQVLNYWDRMGSPSNIHRWCCGVMKTAPLYRHLKHISGKGRQPHVMSFIGTRSDESLRRSTYNKIAKDAKHTNVVNVSPILDWSTTEVWLYILLNSLPFNKAYRMGLGRVGCVSCPFGSDWNDYLCNHLFPETNKPFLDKLRLFASRTGVSDIENYIRLGNWKIRAGGSGYETKSNVSIVSTSPDFKALITHPNENIFEWLKTLGKYNLNVDGLNYEYSINYNKRIFRLIITENEEGNNFIVEAPNAGDDIFFVSHLKRILNKATYCVNCELCEVECPTGALVVEPKVHIDESKCVKCHKCLDFKDNGCITANSIKKSEGIKMESNKDKKTTINRYNNFGFRDAWLGYYLTHVETFFDNDDHGINVKNQLSPFLNWLRDAEILSLGGRSITEKGSLLSKVYPNNPILVWQIVWINLVMNSGICAWFHSFAKFEYKYSKDELEALLEQDMPQYGASVRKNALGAFQNSLTTSPLGDELGVGAVIKENGRPYICRRAYNGLSLVAIAYSLYKYAEKNERYSLTVSEFYNEEQKEGLYRQFGINREILEQNLRSLEQESNHVLRAELKMGLDNIILRNDLTSLDILKLLL